MRTSRYDEKIFEWVKVYFRIHGYAPSFREISLELGISVNTVHLGVQRLLDKGLLETDIKINGNCSEPFGIADSYCAK